MAKYAIVDKEGYVISRHSSIDLANKALKKIDSVHHSLGGTDVDWIDTYSQDIAYQGYNHNIVPVESPYAKWLPAEYICSKIKPA